MENEFYGISAGNDLWVAARGLNYSCLGNVPSQRRYLRLTGRRRRAGSIVFVPVGATRVGWVLTPGRPYRE